MDGSQGRLVLGGLLVGYRFRSLAIGPLQCDRPFRISRYRGPGAWSRGWVRMVPAAGDESIPRAMVMVFAGPAANPVSGSALLLLPFSKGISSWFFIIASVTAGLVELLPFRGGTLVFDGSRLLALCHRGRGARWIALARLGDELGNGVQPESLPADDIATAIAFRDDSSETVVAHAIAYGAAFLRHEDDAAARLLEICLEHSAHVAPTVREALTSDAAVFQARRRRRVDLAEGWLADLPETTRFPGLRARAEAGILEARDDLDGASRKLDEVEQAMLALPSREQREASLRYVRRWRSELRSVSASS